MYKNSPDFYLAHPTLSRSNILKWEKNISNKIGLRVLNPFYDINTKETKLLDSGNAKPFDNNFDFADIVENDLGGINICKGLLAIIDKNIAIGTLMEIFYAKYVLDKPVITICTKINYRSHPWLKYFSDKIFYSYRAFEKYWPNRFDNIIQNNIGLVGRKRVGKDTVASYLSEKYNYKKFAIANKIKETAWSWFNFGFEEMENKPLFVRRSLQRIGDIGRELDKDLWINILVDKIQNYQYILPDVHNRIVVSDIRMPEEADRLRKLGFKIWKVNRPETMPDNHITETEVDKINADVVLWNNSGKKELYRQVDKLMGDKN